MLLSLHVRDLALIESAELTFAPGLNVISGETGGGKSLVVTALKLLRGERANAGLVRHGASALRVDGEFTLAGGDDGDTPTTRRRAQAVREWLAAELGEAPSGDVLLVTRIVDLAGRSRVRIDDRPATLATLRALGQHLIEIHGQDDSRCLMRPELQAETLDAWAGEGAVAARDRFAAALRAARAAQRRLDDVRGDESQRAERVALLRDRLLAMEGLALQPGEVAALEDEHRLLAHADHQRELLAAVLADLCDDDDSAGARLARALRRLDEAAGIDARLQDAARAVRDAEVHVDDAVRAARRRLDGLELDPERLGQVEQRLAEVRDGLRRHGPTEAAWLRGLDATRSELAQLTGEGADPAALAAATERALAAAVDAGRALLRARKKAVPGFCAAVAGELAALRMPDTRLRVDFAERVAAADLLAAATEHGPGPLELMVRINPGEPFHPLRETASGGELARIVLAIKKCLADQDRVPFLVFDEIDSEIGGRLGLQVGRKLREVAADHQVLIVTHLPQVAAFAHAHLQVDKEVHDGRTRSLVRQLDARERERELAAMAAGEGADPTALAEARRLMARASE